VPLTLFRMDAQQQSAVIEMGMNHPGEIARLAPSPRRPSPWSTTPSASTRNSCTPWKRWRAKRRRAGRTAADGVAVFPHGDEFAIWEELAAAAVLRFGLTRGRSELQLPRQRFRQRDVHHRLRSEADPRQFFVRLQAAGEHNVRNALAAVACTYAAGVPLEKSNWDSILSRRSVAACSASSRNGAVVIDDTYNANPDSVRAAIDVLAKPPRRACWCWAIWAKSAAGREFHEEIGAYAQDKASKRCW
jgi:UDP-N-acetylmuramoyl-tripeptide--D-alanyl-D-alanine ligase